ncbi:hypothetical protein [Planomonospora sp. ID82291]|nr:hypothetical protein [Planomonospora sp. ID82291]MBG0814991.1 hypothetical protein [Planomonospora sp. ID82291]
MNETILAVLVLLAAGCELTVTLRSGADRNSLQQGPGQENRAEEESAEE